MADYKNVIDVSYCQGNINWDQVNVDAVIIRAGYGRLVSQKDAYFERNYAGCKRRGIPCGVYWYSYAMNEEQARMEADACLAVIKDKKFEFPIYYDVEENSQFNLGRAAVSRIIRAFLERVEKAGYWVGLYGSYSSLTTFTEPDIRQRYSIWLAHWGVKKSPYQGEYGLWQTGIGRRAGINGDVDIDTGFVDYPALIKAAGLNGYGKPEPEPQPQPVCPYAEPRGLVKKGDRGEDVKWVQWQLINKNYSCGQSGIDGIFGNATDKALRDFQRASGLVADGICGPLTKKAFLQ